MNCSSIDHSRRAVICTGGNLGTWASDMILPHDFLIGADRGAHFLVTHGFVPDLSLGDFDSVTPEEMQRIAEVSRELLSCDPVDKDWTDTELAVREALSRGFTDIRILGGLGTRFDHSLANVHLLRQASLQGSDARILDQNNEIRLCTGECRIEADSRYRYVSLLPLTTVVRGVTLQGFQYPLDDAALTLGWSLGVSNTLRAAQGLVKLTEGELLVIRSTD